VRGPRFAWAHFNRGLALARSGRLTDARSAYSRAIELDPNFPEARINRGLVELELNQLDDARIDLEAGIAGGRDDAGVLAALGETLARMGRRDEADRFFRRSLETHPDDPNVYVARGMTRLGSDVAGARDDFTRALEIDPTHAPAHYGIARVLRSRDAAAALSHLDEALKSDPNLLDAVQLRALVRARLADPAAIDDVDRLLEKPTPHRLYNAACALAVYSEKVNDPRWLHRSLDLLTRAARMGFPIREADSDPDLRIVRELPGFRALASESSRSGR
jgi:tetratricopeptide (TPR) repeat protein